MQKLGTITPDQIETTCKKHVCNYFFVTDVNEKTRHVQLGRKTDLSAKIAETLATINGLNDNMFVITFIKSSNGKNPAQYPYYLSKHPGNLSAAPSAAPQTIINTPFEPARTMSEALKDAHELATLKADNKRLQDEVNRLTTELNNMQSEAMAEEEEKSLEAAPTSVDKIGGFLKDVLPQFMPLADKYFEIAEKKLALQAMAMNKPTPAAPAQRKAHPFRPFWNPEQNPEKTAQYFNWIENLPDTAYYQEMQQLSTQAPGLHAVIMQMENNDTNEEENA